MALKAFRTNFYRYIVYLVVYSLYPGFFFFFGNCGTPKRNLKICNFAVTTLNMAYRYLK